ncbi:MAG: DNA replication and repair protein RecF [Raineya sp.]|jgi:DNA replication and repair protein RecF|nr:DNA replication and repair protein RecF [Raineya sp.]
MPNNLQIIKIKVQNFKNYKYTLVDFGNCLHTIICGANGIGKTNLLDAIYFLSLTKSAFHSDKQLIKHEEIFFRLEADYHIEDIDKKAIVTYTPSEKKSFIVNNYHYPSLAEYIGQFPVILIAPNDTDLIREGSEERRRFFDTLLCQIDKSYLQKLSECNKILKQRNALLTHFKEQRNINTTLLEVYDEQLLPLMEFICTARSNLLNSISSITQKYYDSIAQSTEKINMIYQSDCLDIDFKNHFKNALQKDYMLERTTQGIHKDDFDFLLGDIPIKKFGSQGQQKTFVIALKFATFEILRNTLNITPILLLDDILDKLDQNRTEHLMKIVSQEPFGQVIVTEANIHRVEYINQKKNWKIIEIDKL